MLSEFVKQVAESCSGIGATYDCGFRRASIAIPGLSLAFEATTMRGGSTVLFLGAVFRRGKRGYNIRLAQELLAAAIPAAMLERIQREAARTEREKQILERQQRLACLGVLNPKLDTWYRRGSSLAYMADEHKFYLRVESNDFYRLAILADYIEERVRL